MLPRRAACACQPSPCVRLAMVSESLRALHHQWLTRAGGVHVWLCLKQSVCRTSGMRQCMPCAVMCPPKAETPGTAGCCCCPAWPREECAGCRHCLYDMHAHVACCVSRVNYRHYCAGCNAFLRVFLCWRVLESAVLGLAHSVLVGCTGTAEVTSDSSRRRFSIAHALAGVVVVQFHQLHAIPCCFRVGFNATVNCIPVVTGCH